MLHSQHSDLHQIGGLLIVAGGLTTIRSMIRINTDPIGCLLMPLAVIAVGVVLVYL